MDGFDLILLGKGMEEKIIQNEQFYAAQVFLPASELFLVGFFEEHEGIHQVLRTEVFNPVV